MANKRISELPEAATLQDSDLLAVVQKNGPEDETRKVTMSELRNAVGGGGSGSNVDITSLDESITVTKPNANTFDLSREFYVQKNVFSFHNNQGYYALKLLEITTINTGKGAFSFDVSSWGMPHLYPYYGDFLVDLYLNADTPAKIYSKFKVSYFEGERGEWPVTSNYPADLKILPDAFVLLRKSTTTAELWKVRSFEREESSLLGIKLCNTTVTIVKNQQSRFSTSQEFEHYITSNSYTKIPLTPFKDSDIVTIKNLLNTKQNIIDSNLQTTNKTVVGAINEIREKAIEKSKAIVFATEQNMLDWIAGNFTRPDDIQPVDLSIGDNIYIEDSESPDFWVTQPQTVSQELGLSELGSEKIEVQCNNKVNISPTHTLVCPPLAPNYRTCIVKFPVKTGYAAITFFRKAYKTYSLSEFTYSQVPATAPQIVISAINSYASLYYTFATENDETFVKIYGLGDSSGAEYNFRIHTLSKEFSENDFIFEAITEEVDIEELRYAESVHLQAKQDYALETEDKTIVGAINELNEKIEDIPLNSKRITITQDDLHPQWGGTKGYVELEVDKYDTFIFDGIEIPANMFSFNMIYDINYDYIYRLVFTNGAPRATIWYGGSSAVSIPFPIEQGEIIDIIPNPNGAWQFRRIVNNSGNSSSSTSADVESFPLSQCEGAQNFDAGFIGMLCVPPHDCKVTKAQICVQTTHTGGYFSVGLYNADTMQLLGQTPNTSLIVAPAGLITASFQSPVNLSSENLYYMVVFINHTSARYLAAKRLISNIARSTTMRQTVIRGNSQTPLQTIGTQNITQTFPGDINQIDIPYIHIF